MKYAYTHDFLIFKKEIQKKVISDLCIYKYSIRRYMA